MSLAYEAMEFARARHAGQRRKYTNNPYHDHLGEVAGIALTVCPQTLNPQVMAAVCWLHDCMDDQGVPRNVLAQLFGSKVAEAVSQLSDGGETGNRAHRKADGRRRLAVAWDWVQTIKCADIISNTSSIVMHDPEFAALYLEEKRMELDVMTRADPRLVGIARAHTYAGRVPPPPGGGGGGGSGGSAPAAAGRPAPLNLPPERKKSPRNR